MKSCKLNSMKEKPSCAFCKKLVTRHGSSKLIQKALYCKYPSSQNYIYSVQINKLLQKQNMARTHFLDDVMVEEQEEFLLKVFSRKECGKKIIILVRYYQFHHEIPRLFNDEFNNIFHYFYDSFRKIEYIRIKQLLDKKDEGKQQNRQKQNHNQNAKNKFYKFELLKKETSENILQNTDLDVYCKDSYCKIQPQQQSKKAEGHQEPGKINNESFQTLKDIFQMINNNSIFVESLNNSVSFLKNSNSSKIQIIENISEIKAAKIEKVTERRQEQSPQKNTFQLKPQGLVENKPVYSLKFNYNTALNFLMKHKQELINIKPKGQPSKPLGAHHQRTQTQVVSQQQTQQGSLAVSPSARLIINTNKAQFQKQQIKLQKNLNLKQLNGIQTNVESKLFTKWPSNMKSNKNKQMPQQVKINQNAFCLKTPTHQKSISITISPTFKINYYASPTQLNSQLLKIPINKSKADNLSQKTTQKQNLILKNKIRHKKTKSDQYSIPINKDSTISNFQMIPSPKSSSQQQFKPSKTLYNSKSNQYSFHQKQFSQNYKFQIK